MASVKLNSAKSINRMVSRLPGVHATVEAETTVIHGKVSSIMAAHYYEGESEVKMKMGRVDGHVWLEDPAALSIEYGHWVYNRGSRPIYVPGIYAVHIGSGIFG